MALLRRPPLGRIRDAALTRAEYMRRAGRSQEARRVVAIVGMHRSGTSAVTGSLQRAGLYLGNVSRKNQFNPLGTREHGAIVKLHDEILAHSGGSWRDPPARMVWTEEHRSRRDEIVASFGRAQIWGFKDPRTILLLDFWREALGESLALVGVFREPAAVVSSLLRRGGGEATRWCALWELYNAMLLAEHGRGGFPLVECTMDAQAFNQQLTPVLCELGLRATSSPGFFDPGLLGRDAQEVTVPDRALHLYERLRTAASPELA